ncbi:MAG: peptide ABC transporter substrate-binding protein [Chlamydiia bacterium]
MMRTLLPFGLLAITLMWMIHSHIEEKSSGNILRVNMTQDPSTLDPRKASDHFATTLHFHLYEGLMRITRQSTAAFGVAESVEISHDRKLYKFTLKDTYWSNGEPVTAYDFEYAWKESIRPNFCCPNAHMLYIVKNGEKIKMGNAPLDSFGAQALDNKTLLVELEHSAPYFLQMLSFPVFFPVPKEEVLKNASWSKTQSPPANGPFTCTFFNPNQKIILKKNSSYWAKHEVNPDEIQIHLIRDESTALNLYEQKELDLIGGPFTSIPVDSFNNFKDRNLLQKKDLALSIFTTFNIEAFPFNNVHIRKAFSMAINRDSIVENVTQNGEHAATTFIPPIMKTNPKPLSPSFDPELARKELEIGMAELNVTSLGTLTYHYPLFGYHDRVAQAIQENFRDILKVDVRIEGVEIKTFLSLAQSKQYQFGQFLWIAMYNDQYSILERFKNRKNYRNYPGWKSKEYVDLLNLSENTFDSNLRDTYLEQAEKILLTEFPLSPIFHGNYVFMEQNNKRGFYISPIGSAHLQWIEFSEDP